MVAVSARFGASSNESRRSCDSQKGLSGLRDVRQEYGKSSGLCGKVWYGWAPLADWKSWVGGDLMDDTEQHGLVERVPAQGRGLELEGL